MRGMLVSRRDGALVHAAGCAYRREVAGKTSRGCREYSYNYNYNYNYKRVWRGH